MQKADLAATKRSLEVTDRNFSGFFYTAHFSSVRGDVGFAAALRIYGAHELSDGAIWCHAGPSYPHLPLVAHVGDGSVNSASLTNLLENLRRTQ